MGSLLFGGSSATAGQSARRSVALALLATVATFGAANAAVITYTANGTGNDGPLSASAQFTTSAGAINIILTNLLGTDANGIRSVGQTISDLSFTLSNAAGTLGALTASGQQGNVDSSGKVTFVSGSPGRFIGTGGGNFQVSGSNVTLEAIGGGQPTELIAPFVPNGGTFGNTNPGIGSHNPYTIGPATFTLSLAGVTNNTTVTSATFSFGTGPDTFLTGTTTPPTPPPPPPGIPEPATLGLLGVGLLGLGLVRRQRA